MDINSNQRIFFPDLKAFCCQAYIKVGVPADEAEIIAGLLARADCPLHPPQDRSTRCCRKSPGRCRPNATARG